MSAIVGAAVTGRPGQRHSVSATVVKAVTLPTILSTIALVTYGLRIHSRKRAASRLRWDDHAITAAMLLALAFYFLNTAAFVISAKADYFQGNIKVVERVLLLGFVSQLCWIWAATMIKTSVALMILRIKQDSQHWRGGLLGLIGVLLFSAVGHTIVILQSCRPIKANWTVLLLVKPGVCQAERTSVILLWVATGIFVATDVICALLPLAFIVKIRRPLREKITLALLMALGLLAAVCSLMKTYLYSKFHNKKKVSPDPVWDGIDVALWALSELLIGVIAANIPCLRAYLQAALRTLGGHVSRMMPSIRSVSRTKPEDIVYSKGSNAGPYGQQSSSSESHVDTVNPVRWEDGQILVKRDLESKTVARNSRDDDMNFNDMKYNKAWRG